MSDWQPIGAVLGLQIHTAEIVFDGRYHIENLMSVDRLWLTSAGVVGVADGLSILDYHHRDHPELRAFKPGRQLSIGFSGHYAVMAERFGSVGVGVAAENITVSFDGVLVESDLAAGLLIETADGAVELSGAAVARPCVPFTKFLLVDEEADPEIVAAYRASLDHGVRGFVMALTDVPAPGIMVRAGDQVYRRV